MVTIKPAVANARLLDLNYFLATFRTCSWKILLDSCRVFLKHLFSHPTSRASCCLLEWRGEKEALHAWITSNLCGRHGPTSRLVNLVLSRQTGFFECEHPFLDKPMVIYRSRWSNMPRMFNKDLTPFMRSLSLVRQNWVSERQALQDEPRQANIADTVYWGS